MKCSLSPFHTAVAFLGLAIATLSALVQAPLLNADQELKVGKLNVGKMLFLGNSITLHGPAPNIGWTGNWGMAASAREKDYVHLLLERIMKATGGTPKVMIRNIADFERQLTSYNIQESLKEELAFQASIIILAIGENTASPKTEEARRQFSTALDHLLTQLKHPGHPTIMVRTQFWPEAEKDQLLKKACHDAEGILVDLGKFGNEPSYFARSERHFDHAGVANHPGDKGMAAIADALWAALKHAGNGKK